MKPSVLKKMTKTLEREKYELLAKQQNPLDIDVEGDDIDAIQANIIAHTQNQLNLRDKIRLKCIDSALTKIVEGKYGLCEECDEPIAIERLKFNPTFALCIVCAEEIEFRNKK